MTLDERRQKVARYLTRLLTYPPSVAGVRAAALLDALLDGLHHFPGGVQALRKVDWAADAVEVALRNEVSLATTDFDRLTRLVFLAHDHAVRVEILPHMRDLKLLLHPRSRKGLPVLAHPQLADVLLAHRAAHPADDTFEDEPR